MLHTTTDGKNTSESGTDPSRVVWTVELRNSLVLSCRKKPPETTDMATIRDQKEMRKVEMEQDTSLKGVWKKRRRTLSHVEHTEESNRIGTLGTF